MTMPFSVICMVNTLSCSGFSQISNEWFFVSFVSIYWFFFCLGKFASPLRGKPLTRLFQGKKWFDKMDWAVLIRLGDKLENQA